MRYELLLQPIEPGAPYDCEPTEAELTARGIRQHSDGTRLWRLKNGDVEVWRLAEVGQVVATVLRVPLSEKTELVGETVREALTVAQSLGLRVVDPQLAKNLLLADEGLVTDNFLRMSKYAGEYIGVSEAVVASYGVAEPTGLKPGTKVMLALGAFFIVLYLVVDRLL